LVVNSTEAANWTQLTLRHKGGVEIAVIERNPVVAGELGEAELLEFTEEVKAAKPESAARWLADFLPRVKVIYAFQLLGGTDVNDGWSAVHAVQSCIWNKRGGILQADGEGFSNEDGYHILWQFADHVKERGIWRRAMDMEGGSGLRWTSETENSGPHSSMAMFRPGQDSCDSPKSPPLFKIAIRA
jgi:hypothetical protein